MRPLYIYTYLGLVSKEEDRVTTNPSPSVPTAPNTTNTKQPPNAAPFPSKASNARPSAKSNNQILTPGPAALETPVVKEVLRRDVAATTTSIGPPIPTGPHTNQTHSHSVSSASAAATTDAKKGGSVKGFASMGGVMCALLVVAGFAL
ncbi:hypothetical protein BT63DRAFT_416057 [Microthyrium microscopicum]|uniref:Uncharacterized protein n=1 Tax=Microthyrium microscopicum TaxID=703497 RepID=A0A6A6U5X8_9PEZI|nr:hypothetical protein BT63DRAFT_416057 [Microthyrium microscopicum]